MGIIYKITNKINGKFYIGLTTTSLEERWKCHINSVWKVDRHLYFAMRKYGVENFSIEQIDSADDFEELGRLERYYIKKFNSTNQDIGYNITSGGERNQLDGNPRAKLTVEDVENIRDLYNECKIGCKEAWKIYKEKISFDAFQKVYEGYTWKSVKPEVYTEENKKAHVKMKSNPGEKNGNALLKDEEVVEIRNYYVNHNLEECYSKFGFKFKSKTSFRAVIDKSYLHLPIYSKKNKCWLTKIETV